MRKRLAVVTLLTVSAVAVTVSVSAAVAASLSGPRRLVASLQSLIRNTHKPWFIIPIHDLAFQEPGLHKH
jgi:hypothetical protein